MVASDMSLPSGLVQIGSVGASHENPPPYEPPVVTTRCGFTLKNESSAICPAS